MSPNIIQLIEAEIGSEKVLKNQQLIGRFSHIWASDPLKGKAIFLPKTTQDVEKVLTLCNTHKQSVVIHGGLTNLVGGTKSENEDVIISLEKMNTIIKIDKKNKTVVVEAGVILETLHTVLAKKNLFLPLTFGAKGSAHIGGIISTNAGGLRVLKYGTTRNFVLGLEFVTGSGKTISSLKHIIKDNTGYDMKSLLVGSEGTLGIVTKAVLKLYEKPESRASAFIGVDTYGHVVELLKHLEKSLSGSLSGVELLWTETYQAQTSTMYTPPLPKNFPYYVLVETLSNNAFKNIQSLTEAVEELVNKKLVLDAVFATSSSELENFWRIREDVSIMKSKCIYDQHFDISIPISLIGNTITSIKTQLLKLNDVNKVFAFGHIADNNIHLIVDKSNLNQETATKINSIVYTSLKNINGSISAEHGIGVDKKEYLSFSRSNEEIMLMRQIKMIFDPNGILNKNKIFDIVK